MKILISAIVAIGALSLAACGSGGSGGGSGGGSDTPIKIPVIVSDTGTYAFAGVVSHKAMELAVDKVNRDGGIHGRNLELSYNDDGSQNAQSLTLLGKLAADNDTVAIMGPTATPLAASLGPVANARKVPLLGTTVISGSPLKTGPWMFKTSANPSSVMTELGKVSTGQLKLKTVAVIFGRDNQGQVEQKDAFENGIKSGGGQIATEVGVLNTDTNFTAAAQKAVEAKPDAVYVSLTGDASGNAVAQLKSAGLPDNVQILGTSQSVSQEYLSIGGRAVEGTIAGTDYDPSLDNPTNKAFTEAYKSKNGILPDSYAALGYQSVLQLAESLKSIKGDINRDSVKDALTAKRSYQGVLGNGKYTIGDDRVPEYGVALLKVTGGQFVTFHTTS